MPQRKKVTEKTEEVEDIESAEVPPDPELEEDDLSRVLADIGNATNAFIKVERVREGRRMEFVDDYPAEAFSLKLLQEAYGGGDYQLTGRTNGRYAFKRTVSIAQPLQRPQPTNDTGALASVIQEGFKQQNEQMTRLIMLVLGTKQGGDQVDPDQVRSSLLNDLKLMREIMGDGGRSQDNNLDAAKVMELLKMGIDFGKDAAGVETGPLDLLGKAFDAFGKPIAAALSREQLKQEYAARQARLKQPPAGGQARRASGPQPAAQPTDSEDKVMRDNLRFLIQQAATDGDPSLWAEVIVDQFPETQLRAFLGQGDPVAALAAIDAGVENHREWFATLGKEVNAILDGESVPGADVSTSVIDHTEDPPETVQDHGDAGDHS